MSLSLPADDLPGTGVSIYLFALADRYASSLAKRAPLQVALHYIVTTWAADPLTAHGLLSTLLFKAMESPDFTVQLSPPVDWPAFGIKPRPAFVLQLPCRMERPVMDEPLVSKPLRIRSSQAGPLRGVILTDSDVPVAGAYVELPNLDRVERTDQRGRFVLPMVPTEPRQKMLTVRAKGHVLTYAVEHDAASTEPVVVRFNLKEK